MEAEKESEVVSELADLEEIPLGELAGEGEAALDRVVTSKLLAAASFNSAI